MGKYTTEELRRAVRESRSYSGVLRNLGLAITGSSCAGLKKKIAALSLDIRHFTFKSDNALSWNKKSAAEILVFDETLCSKRTHFHLKRSLIEIGRPYLCEKCGISEWCGERLTLEVDHTDGDWRNNTPDNLRFLCPNCHSLTPNFFHTVLQAFCRCGKPMTRESKLCLRCSAKENGKRIRKMIWPTKEYLEKLVYEKPMVHIAAKFGVSDTAVRKWCKKYGIVHPGRGFWAKKYAGVA